MRALSAIAIATLTAGLTAATPGHAQAPAPHDPRDLSGVWTRTSPLLTLSQTPPPFTPLGKKLFDANKPSYGPGAVPPAVGNDPMGNCDPLGLVRNLLLEQRRQATEAMRSDRAHALESDDGVIDIGEMSELDLNRSTALNLGGRQMKLIEEIDDALLRIEDGTYGQCECCVNISADSPFDANFVHACAGQPV